MAQQKSIVLVDDKPENLRLLVGMLGDQGYKVRPAINAKLAIDSILENPPDLILLDILMPDVTGYEVCEQLKAYDHVKDIPIIFISALDDVFDKVKAFSVGGVDYITKPFQLEEVLARVKTQLMLREAQQQVIEQNRELEAFAHTAAHDLKSPLTNLIGLFELQKMQPPQTDQEFDELFEFGTQIAYKMNNIIDELLLLSSVRNENIPLAPISNMGDVVQHACERLHTMFDNYNAEITAPNYWPSVLGYAPWIEEVWVNYISNGLKYGGTPPVLQVGADVVNQDKMCFWVMDNGQGLSPEQQTQLFNEFVRLDPARAEGYGLGLSIVQRIINKLGGEVGVESYQGQGSKFYFTLPVA